jgi:hypothetical protein
LPIFDWHFAIGVVDPYCWWFLQSAIDIVFDRQSAIGNNLKDEGLALATSAACKLFRLIDWRQETVG